MNTATDTAVQPNRQSVSHGGRLDRHAVARKGSNYLTGTAFLPGIVCAVWAMALSSGNRTLPVLFLSLWGVVATWALPLEDTVPVVLLCLSVSRTELPGIPLEEMGSLLVVALWIGRSLLGALLRHRSGRVANSVSVLLIVVVMLMLTCNLVVASYQGIEMTHWIKNALPWFLCLAAYPASRMHWTPDRIDRIVDMISLAGSMVSVADMVQFTRGGGAVGLAELGGQAYVSILPLLAIVAIVASWDGLRATVGTIGRRLGLLAGFTVCLARIVMSLQRAWVIGAVVGLGVWFWASRSHRSVGLRRLASTSSLVLGVTLALVLVVQSSQFLQDAYGGLVARIGRSWVNGEFDYSIGTRLNEVSAALQAFRRSPLFGTGLGSLIDYVRPNGVPYSIEYIHIGPVFVLTKLGVFGFLVVAWFIVRVATALRRAVARGNPVSRYAGALLGAVLCVVFVLFCVSRYVFKPSNAALIWLLIGMALSLEGGDMPVE